MEAKVSIWFGNNFQNGIFFLDTVFNWFGNFLWIAIQTKLKRLPFWKYVSKSVGYLFPKWILLAGIHSGLVTIGNTLCSLLKITHFCVSICKISAWRPYKLCPYKKSELGSWAEHRLLPTHFSSSHHSFFTTVSFSPFSLIFHLRIMVFAPSIPLHKLGAFVYQSDDFNCSLGSS